MKKIFSILGIIIILYVSIINKVSSTRIAFSIPLIIIGIAFMIFGITSDYIVKFLNKNESTKKCLKIIKVIIAISIGVFILIEGAIVIYPKNDRENSDYILVLGAGLSNGKYPSLTLSRRLDAAIEAYEFMGKSKKIVVTGGKGNNEDISEAEAMKNYLISKGIEEDMIISEDKSRTTYQNFKFSKEVIENDSGNSIRDVNVKIVTTDFHALRSRIIAKKRGYGEVSNYSSDTVWYLIPVNYLRESLALVKSIIFD